MLVYVNVLYTVMFTTNTNTNKHRNKSTEIFVFAGLLVGLQHLGSRTFWEASSTILANYLACSAKSWYYSFLILFIPMTQREIMLFIGKPIGRSKMISNDIVFFYNVEYRMFVSKNLFSPIISSFDSILSTIQQLFCQLLWRMFTANSNYYSHG